MSTWASREAPRPVPYLTAREIEQRAMALLADYERRHGPVVEPPVPIDEILELHLGLQLEFGDLSARLGRPGVLGALLTSERCIAIDGQLDPNTHPRQEGRYRFTLAHEVGHWVLHRDHQGATLVELATEDMSQAGRSRERQRIEVQANLFASCLLMPRLLVRRVWRDIRGSDSPFCVEAVDERSAYATLRAVLGSVLSPDDERGPDDVLLEHFSRPFAARFQVSAEAMRIRLEQLQLVIRADRRR
ncbi:MAG: ImmA/IrrE family metallo-endopeptidase [Phycisphaerales bacterium]|nr:ImmA/IrrE family metallo-endopeptidase [Phycisphaerales bacterium]